MAFGLSLSGLGASLALDIPPRRPPTPPRLTELAIAKTKSLYMVIDIPKNLAVLKARGIAIRTFPLQTIKWIGDPLSQPLSLQLKGKEPMVSPLSITPPPTSDKATVPDGEEEPPISPAKALTVSDMPFRYELAFQDHLNVIIQPDHLPSFWGNAWQQMGGWKDRVAAHMSTWKAAFGQPSISYLVLSMEPAEAQAFYWAVVPPMPWLVVPGTPGTTP
ncbi:MAG: hypothetical protein OEY91_08730 [Nitrospirota bacterium]|nr:hypothetical protein [Nitrospirota bacterium]